jgi:CubicO group peptidase (beta-lactamase class C family)
MSQPAPAAVPIEGVCDPRFEAVREAFAANFAEATDPEWGAAVCVRAGGRVVADVWGGHVDAERTRPWRRDTLVNAYSVGKGILAILALSCVEEGLVDLDAPVASLWPEFAARGKDRLTVRALMGHRAGLPGVREPLPGDAAYDWPRMCAALAAQAPWWEPGTDHGYHVNTQGFLVGEVLRRATGVPVGRLLRERLCGPLGTDYWWGLPAREHSRVSTVFAPQVPLTTPEQWAMAFPPTGDEAHDTMVWRTYFNPSGLSGIGTVNTAPWREAVIPSTNGHGNARAIAALYDAHMRGGVASAGSGDRVRVAGAGLRAEAVRIVSDGLDRVLSRPSRFGLGFQLPQPTRPIGPAPNAYGHFGYGGSLGMADPDASLAFSFVTNRPGDRWQTPRTQRLLDAVYACL